MPDQPTEPPGQQDAVPGQNTVPGDNTVPAAPRTSVYAAPELNIPAAPTNAVPAPTYSATPIDGPAAPVDATPTPAGSATPTHALAPPAVPVVEPQDEPTAVIPPVEQPPFRQLPYEQPPYEQPSARASHQTVTYPTHQPREPQVGDQYPAAVLPGAQPTAVLAGPEYPSSGPIPVSPPSGPVPLPPPGQQVTAPYSPRKPRNKAVVWLTTAVVFFVLAAGALGTLWLVEVGNHKGTSSELQTVQQNLDKTRSDLKTALSDKDTALAAKQRLERDIENNKPCLLAVKNMMHARTEDDFKKFADDVDQNC
jgi:hypothetical protein